MLFKNITEVLWKSIGYNVEKIRTYNQYVENRMNCLTAQT